jgi:cytochrome c peroxidase
LRTPIHAAVILAFAHLGVVACSADDDDVENLDESVHALSADCDPSSLPAGAAAACQAARRNEGRRLFMREQFDGNGRTCEDCHSGKDGTISLDEVAERLHAHNSGEPDPLFLHDGLDDFVTGTSRISADATILVKRQLTNGVSLVNDPDATHVVLARGVPSTLNTPALDPALMYDIRHPSLEAQALAAIQDHAQNGVEPTSLELELIAEFQQTAPRFFSNPTLRDFAAGGPAPTLPPGETESEKRGREFFVDAPWDPPNKKGVCAQCHSGPMLNVANEFAAVPFGAPPGWNAFNILVSERNLQNNPVHDFAITDACGETVVVSSPDMGIGMTGVYNIPSLAQFLPPPEFCIVHPFFFANMFKTPQLWGVKHTAPYFHDNSAKTLDDVIEHYQFMFDALAPFNGEITLTPQDFEDLKAFMMLL